MKKLFTVLALTAFTAFGMSAQDSWDKVPEFSTYTNANNPVQAGGNNLLQGAIFESYIANDNWQVLADNLQATYSGNSFTTGKITYKVPEGRGSKQWTAQMFFQTQYAIEAGKKYDLTFHVKSTAANNFTVKIENRTNPETKNLCYYYVTLPANQEVLFVLKDASPKVTLDEAKLLFDAGGAQVGSTIEIYDIILQSADELKGPATPLTLTEAPEGYKMVWNDEFDDAANLTKNWNAMDWKAGNVNNELQTYKPGDKSYTDRDGVSRKTLEIKDGKLLINLFEGKDGKIYSGRIDSHDAAGKHSGYAAWRYGYMEARIKLPSGKGTWPAYWMMPEGVNWSDETWPTCGEIDIMEEVGNDPNNCVCSLHAIGHYHSNNTQVSASKHVDNMEGGWVTYALLWDNENIAMYADGQRILTYANDHNGYVNWPYDRPYYITLNLAYGGDWGGAGGVQSQLKPCTMEVEYVRVYQLEDPVMNEDGTGVAYIQGPFNGVAKDGIVPSSTFNSWNDNHIKLEEKDKTYTHEFRIGKNLHKNRVDFMFYATPDRKDGTAFTPDGAKYKATLAENPVLIMDATGHIKLKSGVSVKDGQSITVTLDCSKGTNNAQILVDYNEEIVLPPAPKKTYYIIGAYNSICPDGIGSTDDGWDWNKYYITMEQDADNGYIHRHTFNNIGVDIDPEWVNFKFMPQNSWNGAQFGSDNEWGAYTVSYTGDSGLFKIGTGKNGADNGNIVLADGKSLNAFKGMPLTVILDVTEGEDNAKFYTSLDTSSVDFVTVEKPADDRWYDFSGRVISKPTTPGFYIHGNKKVIIK